MNGGQDEDGKLRISPGVGEFESSDRGTAPQTGRRGDDHPAAAVLFERAIADLPPEYRRDRGVYLARVGRAHASGGDPDQAVAAATQALAIAHQTGSGRIITELVSLNSDLERWKTAPPVTHFREALAESLPRQVPAPAQHRKC